MIISRKLKEYKRQLPVKVKIRQTCIALVMSLLILLFGFFLWHTGAPFLALVVFFAGWVYFVVMVLTIVKLLFDLQREKKVTF